PANLTRAQQLSTVCSRWRNVVEGTPEIWTIITGYDPPEAVNKAIEHSSDMSLDIGYNTKANHSVHSPEDFLQAVSPHTRRWRRASIVLTSCSEHWMRGLTMGMAPRLESFTLRVSYYSGGPLTLFGGVAPPCLRELTVRRVPLLWDAQQFSSLHKLVILVGRWNAPSLQTLLFVLRIAPNLEEFEYWGELSQVLHSARSPGFILLPVMKSLQLYTPNTSDALDILSCIRAPACQKVLLEATMGDFQVPERLAQNCEAMLQFSPLITNLANQGKHVEIRVEPTDARFSISSVDFDLSHPTQIIQVAKWMVQDLSNELMDIDLFIEDIGFTAEQLDSLFPPTLHRRVSKLSIGGLRDNFDQAGAILDYLSSSKLRSDGQVQLPLPHLREIAVLGSSPDLLSILHMLQARMEAVDSPTAVAHHKVAKLCLNGVAIDSKEDRDLISRIDGFLQENGGELWRRDWAKNPPRSMEPGGVVDQVGLSCKPITRSGIQDLPAELIITIISLTSMDEPANLTRAQQLSSVCSQWRNMVETTPEIWTLITGSDPPKIVDKALERSKDMSLDIEYNFKSHRRIHEKEIFLQTVCPHIQRWRRARIVLGGTLQDFLQGLTIGSADRLESLTLWVSCYTGGLITLFEGVALPRLKELSVRRVHLLWNGDQFSNLQKLAIFVSYQLSLQEILSVLRITSKLEEFTYGGELSRVRGDANETKPPGFILLPAMKSLNLSTFRSSGALDILMCIRAPMCVRVSLAADLGHFEDPGGWAQQCEAMFQFLPLIISLANQEECIKIGAGPEAATFSISTVEFQLSHPTQRVQVANWMVKDLSNESMDIDLSIYGQEFTPEQLDLLVPPTLQRRVSKLNISSLGNITIQVGAILEYLSSPKLASDSQVRWPLPYLKEVAVLNRSPDLLGILHMLRARAEAINFPATVEPSKVTKLYLDGEVIDSEEDRDSISRIDEFLLESGGELWRRDFGKGPLRHFFS
ncbi:hypothetical protein FRC01_004571, partial [Tulasnella sp. 417]